MISYRNGLRNGKQKQKKNYPIFHVGFAHKLEKRPINCQKLPYFIFHVGFALFCLQCLAHTESHTALVQRLVGGDGHADFIAHTQQQQPTLSAVDGDLSDQLICTMNG
jgi:hypothetical protein